MTQELREAPIHHGAPEIFHSTTFGTMFLGDSLSVLRDHVADATVDLIVTSPPFGLVRKKDYGNKNADEYVDWFLEFGQEFYRVLKETGSLVIDIGGAWIPGQPTRSLYHYELLIALCQKVGFHLAQDYFWWNPAKLPTPAEWVTVRRIRVKDAVNCIWWLSKTPWPKASNKRVLVPYSSSMIDLIENGYDAKVRPSGHDLTGGDFGRDNGAAIPPNLIAVANTESNSQYLRYCAEHSISPHPARFPVDIPDYFIRMLTDEGDSVIDPFGGSCATGEAAERLRRKWMCVDLVEPYLAGAIGRFAGPLNPVKRSKVVKYSIAHPSASAGQASQERLPGDGGRTRIVTPGK